MSIRFNPQSVRITKNYTIYFKPNRGSSKSFPGLILFLIFSSFTALGQFVETFSDTDLTTGVVWVGNVDEFTVVNGMLQLTAPEAGSSILSTQYTFDDSLRFGGEVFLQFAPSGDNLLRVYLFHEQTDPTLGEALFIELGESGSGDAFIFKYRDALGIESDVQRFASIPHSSTLSVTYYVEYLGNDNWTFSFDHDGDGVYDDIQPVDFGFSSTSTGFFGLGCKYTSSRTDKFFFDNIFIEKIIPDLIPPDLIGVDVVSASKIILNFNEAIAGDNLDVSQFNISPGSISPNNVIWSVNNPQQVCLTFSNDFINQQIYEVEALNIVDENGNVAPSLTSSFFVLVPEEIESGDIILNEIHAAPSQSTLVANAEFVELYNVSEKILDVGDLRFSDAASTSDLPEYYLFPGEHIVVTSRSNTSLFTFVDTLIGVDDFPSLNNSGDFLTLQQGAIIIDQVEYNAFWYNDADKNSGWSLECINPESLCRGAINWTASTDPTGGTPGETNSVFSAEEPPGEAEIEQIKILSVRDIDLVFSIEMDEEQLSDLSNFTLIPSIDISSGTVLDVNGDYTLRLKFEEDLKPGQVYQIIFNTQICACNGNKWTEPLVYSFGLGDMAEEGDVRISEILFSPLSDESEFIELINTSQKIIDVNDLWVHFRSTSGTGGARQLKVDFQLLPNGYHVITPNPSSVLNNYHVPFPNQVHSFALPSLTNSGGFINLYTFDQNGDSVFIDRAIFAEGLHDPLLDKSNGVSLERLRLNGDGYDQSNWYSASTLQGGATPTGENSQKILPPESSNSNFSLESPTFSPDGDGFEDVMVMHYNFDRPGFIAQVKVFSYDGVLIRQLVNNASLGVSGQLIWRGETDDGDRARIGIYYVLIEAFHVDGETIQDKKKIVLARQL